MSFVRRWKIIFKYFHHLQLITVFFLSVLFTSQLLHDRERKKVKSFISLFFFCLRIHEFKIFLLVFRLFKINKRFSFNHVVRVNKLIK